MIEDIEEQETEETKEDNNHSQDKDPRRELLEELSSPSHIAKTQYPEELKALGEIQNRSLASHEENNASRQNSLSQREEEKTSLLINKNNLQEQVVLETSKKDSIEKRLWPFGKEKKIQEQNQKLGKIAFELKNIDESIRKTEEAKVILMEEISERPELEPVREIFRDIMPLFQNDVMTKEQKELLFDPEFLSSLTLEEYVKLWRLGSPYYLGHSTKQGIKDHVRGDMENFAGGGQWEFHNGFKKILEDNFLFKSPRLAKTDIKLSKETTEEEISNIIKDVSRNISLETVVREIISDIDKREMRGYSLGYILTDSIEVQAKDSENWVEAITDMVIEEGVVRKITKQTIDSLETVLSTEKNSPLTGFPYVVDSSAIHFSSGEILNDIYGGEYSNEIFFIFPTDLVASQYTFATNYREGDITKKPAKIENKWNDVFVWTDDETISLNAGIVFLPENTPVNPKNGSIYEEVSSSQLQLARNAIPSKNYWEGYFNQNPTKRPKHIVYYNNSLTPTQAVEEFLEKNSIKSIKIHEEDLGFKEHHVAKNHFDENTPRTRDFQEASVYLVDEIRKLAPKVIAEIAQKEGIFNPTREEIKELVREHSRVRNII